MQGSYSGLIGSCRVLHAQQSYCYPLSGHCMHNNLIAVHYLATARTLKAKFHALDAKGCNIHLISSVTIGFTAVYRHADRMFAYHSIYLFQLQTSYGMYIPLGSGYITAIFSRLCSRAFLTRDIHIQLRNTRSIFLSLQPLSF